MGIDSGDCLSAMLVSFLGYHPEWLLPPLFWFIVERYVISGRYQRVLDRMVPRVPFGWHRRRVEDIHRLKLKDQEDREKEIESSLF